MKISQLSVFLENSAGVINEVTSVLSGAKVNMTAFSVSDGVEFGILRLVVNDVEAALKVLQDAGYKVSTTDVISVTTPNEPGALSAVMDALATENVFIQYMYAVCEGDVARTIFRPSDVDKCEAILDKSREMLLSKSPLYRV